MAVLSADPGAWTHPHSPYAVLLDGELPDERLWVTLRRTGSGKSIDLVCSGLADEARIFTTGLDPAVADPVRAPAASARTRPRCGTTARRAPVSPMPTRPR
ncbi:hypothetical protein [Amycolatopsis ultiminotia]|uniref:hypothetical protein n=1 Tax=Amycolatopsis ultiminotia TaxID=543629 RepID=UPI0031E8B283